MKTQPLISVIVPVYNVEKYISRCLHSIYEQTYKNLEIILIDDGSTDSSLSILDKYAKKDSRVKVVHQMNRGLSAARNTGIQQSHGAYLTFIDSDDYVTHDYVEYMYKLLEQNNFKSSLALCSLTQVFPNGKSKNMGNNEEKIISGKKCIEMMCYHDLVDTCAYAKLGKRELYDDHFFPVGKLFEDIGSTYKLLEQCKTVACGFKAKYFYCIKEDSIVTSKFKPSKLDLLEMTDQMAQSVNFIYPDLAEATARRQVYARFSTLNQTLDEPSTRAIQRKLREYIVAHKSAILNNPRAPRRDKIAYGMLLLGLPIYKYMWKAYLKITK